MPAKVCAAAAVASATCSECSSRPRAVRVVVVLGGERAAKRAATARSGAEQPLHQSGEVGIGEPGDVRVEPALELGDRGGRRVEQPLPVDLERGENALDGELRPVARVL